MIDTLSNAGYTVNSVFKREANKMTLKEVQDALKDRRLSMVADATGIHVNTIRAIRDGKTDPSYSNVSKLAEYLQR